MTVEEAVLAGGFGSAVLEYAHDISLYGCYQSNEWVFQIISLSMEM